jgi:hypothetical protein
LEIFIFGFLHVMGYCSVAAMEILIVGLCSCAGVVIFGLQGPRSSGSSYVSRTDMSACRFFSLFQSIAY